MRSLKTNLNVVGAALVWVLVPVLAALAAPVADKPAESANDKARKALEHTVTVDYDGVTLADILGDLSEKTKVRFVADRTNPNAAIQLKERGVSVRELLRRLDLAGVVIDGTVYVADESAAVERQMRQRVSVDLDEVPLAKALQRLAKQTQTNLVLDPRLPKDARETTITLQLDDVPLETAVRLVVEVANLKPVLRDNVLFVTTEERADKLRREQPSNGRDGAAPARYATPAWGPVPPPPAPVAPMAPMAPPVPAPAP